MVLRYLYTFNICIGLYIVALCILIRRPLHRQKTRKRYYLAIVGGKTCKGSVCRRYKDLTIVRSLRDFLCVFFIYPNRIFCIPPIYNSAHYVPYVSSKETIKVLRHVSDLLFRPECLNYVKNLVNPLSFHENSTFNKMKSKTYMKTFRQACSTQIMLELLLY